jgi:predicted transcriptional regulator
MKTVTANIPERLAAKLDDVAARLDQPRDWIVNQALADWIERENHRHALTLEALADVAAGRTVDHESVKSWAQGLLTGSPIHAAE